jgi:hypothetical protein
MAREDHTRGIGHRLLSLGVRIRMQGIQAIASRAGR